MKISHGLIVFLIVLAIYLLSLNGIWATDHPSSFIQLDWSIWANHSFAVNDSQSPSNLVYSMDDFVHNGQWYIASPPGLSIFSLPFVIIAFMMDGYTPFGQVLIFSEAFIALTGAISAYLAYKISRNFFQEKTSLFLAFAVAFSTLLWPFATYYFQHDLSAMFVLAVAYLALKIKKRPAINPRLLLVFFLCGLAAGCGLLVDYIDAVPIPVVAAYLVLRSRKLSGLLSFLSGSSIGIAGILAYNLSAFGTVLTTSQNLYDKKPFLSDFSTPILQGLFMNFLSPYRGLFLYCPVLILASLGFYLMFRKSKDRSQVALLLAMMLSIVIPYSMWQDVTAGVSFGPRFLIPAIPFLVLPVGAVFERGRFARGLAYILYGVGVVFNGAAALVSVIHPNFPVTPPWTTQIFSYMLSSVWTGYLDVWWLNYLDQYWFAMALAVIAAPLIVVYGLERLKLKDEDDEKRSEESKAAPVVITLPQRIDAAS